MFAAPPIGTPSIMSVMGLLASIENDMGGMPAPVATAAVGLQGTQLLYDEDFLPGPSPSNNEREGGLGKLGLPGGGYQWRFLRASLSGKCSELLFGANWV
jgi:hypothetical protein